MTDSVFCQALLQLARDLRLPARPVKSAGGQPAVRIVSRLHGPFMLRLDEQGPWTMPNGWRVHLAVERSGVILPPSY